MSDTTDDNVREAEATNARNGASRPLVHRQHWATRLTHWAWVVCLFFLLLSGLQIFMARPDLYIGQQSGFGFDNTVLSIGAMMDDGEMVGRTSLFGTHFDTTGWLGAVREGGDLVAKSFPGWMTIPTFRDLATGRVVHFFFAWVLVGVLVLWLLASLFNRHLGQLLMGDRDWQALPRDIGRHARFRFAHGRTYSPLQKLSYAGVMFVAFPLIILTGLTMSPGFNAWFPWTLDLFGGRQTARTIHFATMIALVIFFVVHIVMVVLAGPINNMRAIVTGRYRADSEKEDR